MKHEYKIQIGEWVNVYSTQTIILKTDKEIEKLSPLEIAILLDTEDTMEIQDEDFDWTTEEHDKWDTDGEVKILDKHEIKEQ